MSISSQINRIKNAIESAYSSVLSKGGTIPTNKTVANLASAILSIPDIVLQSKTATPSESEQTIMPDNGYDGLSSVKVSAISKTFVGSSVPRQTAKTVTPTKSSQTAVASGTYTTGAVTVGAIPSEYIVPTGSETKTRNGTYDVTALAQLIVNVEGGGGLPLGIAAFDYGDVVVNSAFTTTRQTFNHNLGVTPDFVIVYATANVATTYSMLWAMRGSFLGYRSSAYNNFMCYHGNSTTNTTITNSNSTSYGVSNMTASTFQLASASSSYYWRAGTYKYIAIKFE